MRILIVGGDSLGYYLAKNLVEAGHKVKLIDADKARCESVANAIEIEVFCGNGTKIETLAAAGAGKADVMIAVTERDEYNLIACEIGKKQFGIKRTISKSNNPKNIRLMRSLGVDTVIDETQIITQLIEHEIDGSQVKLIADINNSDAVITEYVIPEAWRLSGKKVMELEIPSECVLIYIRRAGSLMIPRGSTAIMAGDEVVALTVGNSARQLKRIFSMK